MLNINKNMLDKIETLKQYEGFERGGIIVGRQFEDNTYDVVDFIECEYISQDKHSLIRDNIALNNELQKRYNEDNTLTYLGDWHTHPEEEPIPSKLDILTHQDRFNTSVLAVSDLFDIIIGRDNHYIKSYDGVMLSDVVVTHEEY